ncbi:MAG: oligosaccharide flippase family protein [Victivallales bacterium]|nr:oligosaccharide flippase family protein [Victivallales bacterium]
MILSRYFDKAEYGTYKQVMYVYHVLLTIFTLGLPKTFSYFLPRVEPSQAKSLIRKITNLFFLLGGIFSLLLLLFAPQISHFLKNPELKDALRIFAITPFLLLPTMGLEGILATYKKTMFLAFYNVSTNIFKLLCVALPVMIWNLGYKEALVGFVTASFITFLLALFLKYMPVRHCGNERVDLSYASIFQFSIPLLTASLWGIVIHSADQFFISRYFGREVFADFSNGSFELPLVGMVTGACATVLSPVFARLSHQQVDPKKEIYPLWMSVTEKSAKLIFPLLIYFWVFADYVMTVMYGAKYETSYIFFRYKLIIDFFRIIVFAPLMINTGKVKEYSRIFLVTAVLVVLLEYVGICLVNSPYTISLVSLVCRLGQIFACFYIVAKYFKVGILRLFPWKTIGRILLPSIAILWGEHWLFHRLDFANSFWVLVLSFALYAVGFLGIIIVLRLDYLSVITPLVAGKPLFGRLLKRFAR